MSKRDSESNGQETQSQVPALPPEREVTGLQEYNASVLAQTPGAREAFVGMLELVPDPEGDAVGRIVMQIMGATDVEELDRPWDADGMRDYEGSVLRVKSIHKMESDYEGGLGIYLVCFCDQPGIGEEFVVTTGSVSCVAQLVRAHVAGWLPLEVVPRKAAKATKLGYWPMHLELVRRGQRRRAQVIDQAPEPINV